MLPRNHPDRIQIAFDAHRLVANAGLILPATLALRLGLPQLLRKHLDLGGAPGRANTGAKMMTLVASALAGGDCIDDADVLRVGGTARVLGFTAKAPSTLGTFLRSFRWGHVHLPSGRFAANGAWLAVQVMAHNLARWTARIGLGQQIVTTKTLRRRVFALAGRITRSARRLTLHLPRRWPWEEQFSRALARLRAIPLPA